MKPYYYVEITDDADGVNTLRDAKRWVRAAACQGDLVTQGGRFVVAAARAWYVDRNENRRLVYGCKPGKRGRAKCKCSTKPSQIRRLTW